MTENVTLLHFLASTIISALPGVAKAPITAVLRVMALRTKCHAQMPQAYHMKNSSYNSLGFQMTCELNSTL